MTVRFVGQGLFTVVLPRHFPISMDHFNPFLAHSFVVFKDDRDAKDACDELDGKSMSGDRLTVELARGSGGGGGRGSDRGRFGGGGGRFGGRGGFGRDRDGGYGGRDNRRGGRAPVR